MEAAIQTVVKVYLKSAKGKDSMSGGDFDKLVKKQLGNILSVSMPSLDARRILKSSPKKHIILC